MDQTGKTESVKEEEKVTTWRKISRLLSILLVLTGCWLAIANVWRLSRLSLQTPGGDKSDATAKVKTLGEHDFESSLLSLLSKNELQEGSWQFTGSPISFGVRQVTASEQSSPTARALLAPVCEELDLTAFVEELGRLGVREVTPSGRDNNRRLFTFDSNQFTAWLVVAHSGEYWKFCGAGFAEKSRNSEKPFLQVEALGAVSGLGADPNAQLIDLPFETETIGRRFDSDSRLVATLLDVRLGQREVRSAIRGAGLEISNETTASESSWAATLCSPDRRKLVGCRLIQIQPSRCVMMLAKEPEQ